MSCLGPASGRPTITQSDVEQEVAPTPSSITSHGAVTPDLHRTIRVHSIRNSKMPLSPASAPKCVADWDVPTPAVGSRSRTGLCQIRPPRHEAGAWHQSQAFCTPGRRAALPSEARAKENCADTDMGVTAARQGPESLTGKASGLLVNGQKLCLLKAQNCWCNNSI